jgi:hypothetical protein
MGIGWISRTLLHIEPIMKSGIDTAKNIFQPFSIEKLLSLLVV